MLILALNRIFHSSLLRWQKRYKGKLKMHFEPQRWVWGVGGEGWVGYFTWREEGGGGGFTDVCRCQQCRVP